MSAAEKINGIIDGYIARCEEIIAQSKPGDGLFGMGDDPKKDPCHMSFYEELAAAVKEIAASAPEADEACGAVQAILKAAREKKCPSMARWMLEAIHGLSQPLLPLLTAEQKRELRDWYDENLPRRLRFPVQKDVYKAMK